MVGMIMRNTHLCHIDVLKRIACNNLAWTVQEEKLCAEPTKTPG
jgi:hypothetical protein